MISSSPFSICDMIGETSAKLEVISLETIAIRALGKRCFISSAMRSTPGPQAVNPVSEPHSGQVFGSGIEYPHWWQTRLFELLCSVNQAVQCGH